MARITADHPRMAPVVAAVQDLFADAPADPEWSARTIIQDALDGMDVPEIYDTADLPDMAVEGDVLEQLDALLRTARALQWALHEGGSYSYIVTDCGLQGHKDVEGDLGRAMTGRELLVYAEDARALAAETLAEATDAREAYGYALLAIGMDDLAMRLESMAPEDAWCPAVGLVAHAEAEYDGWVLSAHRYDAEIAMARDAEDAAAGRALD